MNEYDLRMNEAEQLYPHSRDVIERETSDGGFSRGWGRHFIPVEDYWFDIHTHIYEKIEDVHTAISAHLSSVNGRNVRKLGVIPFYTVVKGEKCTDGDLFTKFMRKKDMLDYLCEIIHTPNASTVLYLHYTNPDTELIKAAADMGISGIKLHNACVIMDGGDHQVYLSKQWDDAFRLIGKLGLPIIWHVTQRLSDSPYTGSGRNSYWKAGWEKGVRYTNEDLLQAFLKVVEIHPDINFIAAHQLHIGWERLTGLFGRYPNLYTDTTVGCFVRKDDEMYETDRSYLRDIFIKYSNRILFSTDTYAKKVTDKDYIDFFYDGHIRFIRQLRLPEEALQKIAHRNTERLFLQRK